MTSQYELMVIGGTALSIYVAGNDPDPDDRLTPPTRCRPEPFSIAFERGDGTAAGHGFPHTVWYWKVLTQREINLLLGLLIVSSVPRKSRSVLVKTRTPEDHSQFAYYTAIMRWPDGLTDKRQPNGLYYDVEFTFTHLEAYTP